MDRVMGDSWCERLMFAGEKRKFLQVGYYNVLRPWYSGVYYKITLAQARCLPLSLPRTYTHATT